VIHRELLGYLLPLEIILVNQFDAGPYPAAGGSELEWVNSPKLLRFRQVSNYDTHSSMRMLFINIDLHLTKTTSKVYTLYTKVLYILKTSSPSLIGGNINFFVQSTLYMEIIN